MDLEAKFRTKIRRSLDEPLLEEYYRLSSIVDSVSYVTPYIKQLEILWEELERRGLKIE